MDCRPFADMARNYNDPRESILPGLKRSSGYDLSLEVLREKRRQLDEIGSDNSVSNYEANMSSHYSSKNTSHHLLDKPESDYERGDMDYSKRMKYGYSDVCQGPSSNLDQKADVNIYRKFGNLCDSDRNTHIYSSDALRRLHFDREKDFEYRNYKQRLQKDDHFENNDQIDRLGGSKYANLIRGNDLHLSKDDYPSLDEIIHEDKHYSLSSRGTQQSDDCYDRLPSTLFDNCSQDDCYKSKNADVLLENLRGFSSKYNEPRRPGDYRDEYRTADYPSEVKTKDSDIDKADVPPSTERERFSISSLPLSLALEKIKKQQEENAKKRNDIVQESNSNSIRYDSDKSGNQCLDEREYYNPQKSVREPPNYLVRTVEGYDHSKFADLTERFDKVSSRTALEHGYEKSRNYMEYVKDSSKIEDYPRNLKTVGMSDDNYDSQKSVRQPPNYFVRTGGCYDHSKITDLPEPFDKVSSRSALEHGYEKSRNYMEFGKDSSRIEDYPRNFKMMDRSDVNYDPQKSFGVPPNYLVNKTGGCYDYPKIGDLPERFDEVSSRTSLEQDCEKLRNYKEFVKGSSRMEDYPRNFKMVDRSDVNYDPQKSVGEPPNYLVKTGGCYDNSKIADLPERFKEVYSRTTLEQGCEKSRNYKELVKDVSRMDDYPRNFKTVDRRDDNYNPQKNVGGPSNFLDRTGGCYDNSKMGDLPECFDKVYSRTTLEQACEKSRNYKELVKDGSRIVDNIRKFKEVDRSDGNYDPQKSFGGPSNYLVKTGGCYGGNSKIGDLPESFDEVSQRTTLKDYERSKNFIESGRYASGMDDYLRKEGRNDYNDQLRVSDCRNKGKDNVTLNLKYGEQGKTNDSASKYEIPVARLSGRNEFELSKDHGNLVKSGHFWDVPHSNGRSNTDSGKDDPGKSNDHPQILVNSGQPLGVLSTFSNTGTSSTAPVKERDYCSDDMSLLNSINERHDNDQSKGYSAFNQNTCVGSDNDKPREFNSNQSKNNARSFDFVNPARDECTSRSGIGHQSVPIIPVEARENAHPYCNDSFMNNSFNTQDNFSCPNSNYVEQSNSSKINTVGVLYSRGPVFDNSKTRIKPLKKEFQSSNSPFQNKSVLVSVMKTSQNKSPLQSAEVKIKEQDLKNEVTSKVETCLPSSNLVGKKQKNKKKCNKNEIEVPEPGRILDYKEALIAYNVKTSSEQDSGPLTMEKIKSVVGPCGQNFIVVWQLNDYPILTLERTKKLMAKHYRYENNLNLLTKEWDAQIIIDRCLLACDSNVEKDVARKLVATLAFQRLREHYYTVVTFSDISNGGIIYDPLGNIIKSELQKFTKTKYVVSPDLPKVKKIINDYKISDSVNDLVFSFQFMPLHRREIQKFALKLGLKSRKICPVGFKHMVLVFSKCISVWEILKGLIDKDSRFKENYNLLPPGYGKSVGVSDYRSVNIC